MLSCEKPTLVERIVNVFPGSYFVKCLLFSSVFGVPFLLLTRFLDTLNVEAALGVFGPLLWQDVVTFSFANFVLVFYAVYGVHYMRSKIASIMPQVEPVMPGGENAASKVFGQVCRLFPALVLSVLLGIVSLVSFPTQGEHAAGPVSFGMVVLSFPFVYLAYGSLVWVYVSSIKSLYDIGRQPLRLVEFHEDAHFGMKPFGSLSLSLALVYFTGLGLVFFSFLSIPLPLELAVGVLILMGMVLFFSPLEVIHHKMRAKKRNELDKVKGHLKQITSSLGDPVLALSRVDVKSLKRMFAVDAMQRQVTAMPEWPFDTRTLTLLSAIVLTVVASIVTKYVMLFLRL